MSAELLLAVQVIGTVTSAIGALRQGEASSSAAKFNAQINEQNAQIARQNAAEQAAESDRDMYLRLGMIRANQGASGGQSGQGSVLDIIGDAAAQGEKNKQNIVYQGELKARGYTNTATLDTYSGNEARTGSYLRAGSELLVGGTKAYESYNKLKRS